MTTKYIKFGLRADKSLSDLDSPNQALGNLLDNISTQVDENGLSTGFTTTDLTPVIGLRNTGLADYVNENGQSSDLASLNGSLVEYTPISSPNTQLEIEPRLTIQDYISNFRSVLANPPWVNGGEGPLTDFIPSDRINSSVSASTTGNSSPVLIASLGNNLFTNKVDPDFNTSIEDQDFWNNGVFELGSKLHPSFPNTYGLIQWTGYLSSNFSQEWESTGLFMIEEDIVDDGTNNNWVRLKSVYSRSIALSNVSWTTDGSTTTFSLGSTDEQRLSQVKHICTVMKITISATEYEVNSVNEQAGTCTVLANITAGGPQSLTFTWSLSDDLIRTGSILFTEPRTGGRVRVRYTVWWPNPADIGLAANSTYRTKRFAYAIENSDRLPFSMIYSTYDRNQVFGPYTYKYFVDNKAGSLAQRSEFPLRVNNTISMNYTPPGSISDVVKGMSDGATTIAARTMTIADSYGRLTGDFSGYEVGDWISFETTNPNHFAYQIQEIRSGGIAYVTQAILSYTGLSVGSTISVITFKNLGLIGIYRLSSSGGTQGSLYPVGGQTVSATEVYPDYVITGIAHDGNPGFQPLRITSVDGGSAPNAIVTSDYLSNGSSLPNTSAESFYAAVYATRGLEDLSAVQQCSGVYGREVATAATSGATSVILTTNVGVSVGDYVQFAGLGGTGDPVISEPATVTAVNGNGTTITISSAVRSGKTLNANSTLIFIKAANKSAFGSDNKEYCVIPLNTAPPFEGTTAGLTTPASNANLSVQGITFGALDITVPSSKIVDLASSPLSNNRGDYYFPIKYGNITYKSLINTSG